MRKAQVWLAVLFAVIVGAALVIYLTSIGGDNRNAIINIFFLIPPFIAVLAGVTAVHTYGVDNIHGKALALITLGLAAWFVGEAFWAVYELILKSDPFPSIADVFYLAAYPLMLWGIFTELYHYKVDISLVRSLFLSTFSIVLSILVYNLSILPSLHQNVPLVANLIAASYGLGDVVLIMMIAHLLMLTLDFKGGRLNRAWMCILFGVIFMLLGDIFFALYREHYENATNLYRSIDLLWVASYLSFAWGLLDIHFVIQGVQNKVRSLLAS